MSGIILINKEMNMTSHDVIYKLRKILKTKKIGHCGTLDPMATGVLVCVVGNATKLSNYMVLDTKEYVATFKLGTATTTQDLEGEIVATKQFQNDVSLEKLLDVLNSFQQKIIQTPSIYSAIKVNGKKLYEYARENKSVTIPQREVEIFDIKLLAFEQDLITIKVKASSGTYIRTLCYDIAAKLNYPGVLTKLERTASGIFKIEDSYKLSQLETDDYQLISIEKALSNYDVLEIDEKTCVDVKNGKVLNINMDNDFIVMFDKKVVALYGKSINGIAKMKRGLW